MRMWFDIDDLDEIRRLAKRYLKKGVYKYPANAVKAAKKAIWIMKKQFDIRP